MRKGSPNKFVVYSHPQCALHDVDDHIENPARVVQTWNYLKERFQSHHYVHFVDDYPIADRHHLSLFHTEEMINLFFSKCDLSEQSKTVNYLDMDTPIMNHSRVAVLSAVGAMIKAIDDIFDGSASSGFCCIRPPGHHAEPSRACGFCYFNNIGIGAKYAQAKYNVKKVAVLDFDVHHGNGTEAGFDSDETLFYGSSHEINSFPNTAVDHSPYVGVNSRDPKHRRIVNRGLQSGKISRQQFHEYWKGILDEMVLFQPELILISAGFDAHDDDPLSDIELIEEDYAQITNQIILSALKICEGDHSRIKIISVLEGGYDLRALQQSAFVHINTLVQQLVVEECASFENPYQSYLLEKHITQANAREESSRDDITSDVDVEFVQKSQSVYRGDEVAALKDFMKGLDL